MFKRKLFVSLIAFSCLSGSIAPSATADNTNPRPALLSATEIGAIAQDSVVQEAAELNDALGDPEATSPYKAKLLKSFARQTDKRQVDPAELIGKCTYSESDLVNLGDPVLSPDDDAVAAKMRALQTVGALYGEDVWRLFSQACQLAQKRFEKRLTGLTADGAPVNLSPDEIKSVSSILFFPTLVGRAPSMRKEILNAVFNHVIMGSLIFGPIAALSALAIGNDFILIATASNTGYSLLGELTSVFQKSPNEKLGDLLSRSPMDLKIDLSPAEQAQIRQLN